MNAPLPADIGHNRAPISDVLAEQYSDLAARVEAIATRANLAPKAIATDTDLNTIGALIRDTRELSGETDKKRESEKRPYLQAGRDVDAFFKVFTDRLDRISTVFKKIADDHARAVAAEARRRAEDEARKAREEADRQAEIARRAEEANRLKTAEKHEAKAEAAEQRAEQAEAVAASSAADLVRSRTDSGILSTARTEWAFEITDYDAIPLDKLRPYLKREHVEQAIRAFVKLQKQAAALPGVRVFEDVKSSFR